MPREEKPWQLTGLAARLLLSHLQVFKPQGSPLLPLLNRLLKDKTEGILPEGSRKGECLQARELSSLERSGNNYD